MKKSDKKTCNMHNCKAISFHKLYISGAQFEGNLGKILALRAEISPYIGLREKWDSP